MSCKIITPRQRVTDVWYTIEFYKENAPRNFCWSFPCDEKGNPKLEEMIQAAVDNYNWVKNEPNWHPEIHKNVSDHMENAIAECPYCHRRFQLWNEYMGACECDCGQWFNLFGQELNPPETWDKEYDDE